MKALELVRSTEESSREPNLTSERKENEQVLLKCLMVRSHLEGVASLEDMTEHTATEGEMFELQESYLQMHKELDELGERSDGLTRKKVRLVMSQHACWHWLDVWFM